MTTPSQIAVEAVRWHLTLDEQTKIVEIWLDENLNAEGKILASFKLGTQSAINKATEEKDKEIESLKREIEDLKLELKEEYPE